MLDWLNRIGSKTFTALSAIGLLAGPELETLSVEGFFARWQGLHDLALVLVAPWFRPFLWILFGIFGLRALTQWFDKRYVRRADLDQFTVSHTTTAVAPLEARLQQQDSIIQQQRVLLQAVTERMYVDFHAPRFKEMIKSYDEQWNGIEVEIADREKAGFLTTAGFREQVRRLQNSRERIENRAYKAFGFRAMSRGFDALNRKEPPEASNVPDENIRRSYRELWRENLHHQEWRKQFIESMNARQRDADSKIETSFTGQPPQTYMGLEGGPPSINRYEYVVSVETQTPPAGGAP